MVKLISILSLTILIHNLNCFPISAVEVNTDLNVKITKNEKQKIKNQIKRFDINMLKKRYLKNLEIFQDIQDQLIDSGLPGDFVYIIVVESMFDPNCKYNKYRGLWQLNPYLGRKYGGLRNSKDLHNIDKSTKTAINYFKYLQKEFNDDHRLMLYAYNFGETRIKNLMKKYGKNIPKDKLPSITRQYLPKMMAAKIVLDRLTPKDNQNGKNKP